VRLALGLLLLCAAATLAAQELKPWNGGATPPLALRDLEGRLQRLEDHRGKVVLVNFWATWCDPCRDEMPSLGQLRAALGQRRFEVLAVNLGEPESRIHAFREKVPLNFPVLLDRDTAAAKAWKARILPASFLVGPDGRIVFSHLGELDWSREKVRRRIEELLPN
jgi:thiol-disulfide isomerase/thioredoxin